MSTRPLTGYGPRQRLISAGDEAKYELWEVIFPGYMRLCKLYEVITPSDDTPDEANMSCMHNNNLLSELAGRNLQMLTAIKS